MNWGVSFIICGGYDAQGGGKGGAGEEGVRRVEAKREGTKSGGRGARLPPPHLGERPRRRRGQRGRPKEAGR